jgi:hypothetical protein
MPTELAPGAGLQALRRLAAADQPIGPPRYVLLAKVLGAPADELIDAMVSRRDEFGENESAGHAYRHGWALPNVPAVTDPVRELVEARLESWCHVFDVDIGGASAATALEVAAAAATAYRDGDFLSQHRDDGKHARPNGRVLSFVYWLHRRPRPFSGGELRLCGWACRDGEIVPAPPAVDLEPHHDTLVVFPSTTMHEVFPVRCPASSFDASRFAITGFVRRR